VSIENLKELLDKTEAQTKYKDVKEKNAEQKRTIKILQLQLRKEKKENAEVTRLKVNFAGKKITLKDFEAERQNYTHKFYGEEIERKTLEKFEAESQALTQKELDRLLKLPKKKRPQTLNNLIDTDVNTGVNHILKTPDVWYSWFKQEVEEKIKNEVEKQLNDIYQANVRRGVENAKIHGWKPHLDKYFREKVTPYCRKIIIKKFIQDSSKQIFNVTCTKCGKTTHFNLPPEGIATLLQREQPAYVDCANSQCQGLISHTRIPFNLGNIIRSLIEKPNMPSLEGPEKYGYKALEKK